MVQEELVQKLFSTICYYLCSYSYWYLSNNSLLGLNTFSNTGICCSFQTLRCSYHELKLIRRGGEEKLNKKQSTLFFLSIFILVSGLRCGPLLMNIIFKCVPWTSLINIELYITKQVKLLTEFSVCKSKEMGLESKQDEKNVQRIHVSPWSKR